MREPQLAFAFRISLRIPSDGAALVEGASTGSQLPTDRQRRTATAEQNQRSRISQQQSGCREVFRVRTKAQRHPDLLSRPCSRLRQGRQVQSTAARPSSHFLTVLQSDNAFSLPRACLVRRMKLGATAWGVLGHLCLVLVEQEDVLFLLFLVFQVSVLSPQLEGR